LISELEFTGQQPTFASEPYEQGLEGDINHTLPVWKVPEA
jgi:hypothetical protein